VYNGNVRVKMIASNSALRTTINNTYALQKFGRKLDFSCS
jgi:hypothetical protein